MNYPAVILILASLVQFFVGSLAYVRDILKGKSKPNRMTFLIWAAGPFIGVPAAIVAGATWWALLPVFMAGLGPCVIFLVSFRNPAGYWKLAPLDYACGGTAVLALISWVLTTDPVLAIIFSIIADGLASLPTIIKSWKYPETETGFTYVVALVTVTLGLVFAPSWRFSQVGFLIYLFIADFLLALGANRHRIMRRKPPVARNK